MGGSPGSGGGGGAEKTMEADVVPLASQRLISTVELELPMVNCVDAKPKKSL
jgi:hypothetical protein